jgi:hypothetical protein
MLHTSAKSGTFYVAEIGTSHIAATNTVSGLTDTSEESRLFLTNNRHVPHRASLGRFSLDNTPHTNMLNRKKEVKMKKLMLVVFMLGLFLSVMAVAQYTTQPGTMNQEPAKAEKASAKAVTLSGKISADGRTFVSDKDNKTWTVSNPEALKGHEGHEVMLKAHVDEAKNEIHVTSVKMGKGEMKETKKEETKK